MSDRSSQSLDLKGRADAKPHPRSRRTELRGSDQGGARRPARLGALVGITVLAAQPAALLAQSGDALRIDPDGSVRIVESNPPGTFGLNVEKDGRVLVKDLKVTRLSFGNNRGQLITLCPTPGSAGYGIGIQDGTQYFRTDKNFAWYKGGNHNDGELNQGGGVVQMAITGGRLEVHGPIDARGPLTTLTEKPLTKIPESWGGGVHTWDVYAEGAIGCGKNGAVNCYMLSNGSIVTEKGIHCAGVVCVGKVYAQGGLCFYSISDHEWKVLDNRAGNMAGTVADAGPSDIRLKTDVHPIPRALDKVLQLQGTLFRWSQAGLDYFTRDIETTISAGPDASEAEHRKVWAAERDKRYKALANTNVGVIAQDVEAVLPEAVTVDKAGYKSVRYQSLIPLLVEAIKEQDGTVQQQARTVARQREEIEELRSTQRDMQAELTRLRESIEKLSALATPQDRAGHPDSGRVSPVITKEQGALSYGRR